MLSTYTDSQRRMMTAPYAQIFMNRSRHSNKLCRPETRRSLASTNKSRVKSFSGIELSPATRQTTPPLQLPITMPTPRQSGQEVAIDTRKRPNISPEERATIIALRESGVSVTKLAARYNRSESAIRYTIKTYTSRSTTQEQPRSGRPSVLSRHQQKLVYRAARKTPKLEYHDLQKAAPLVDLDTPTQKPPSRSTLYRCLKRQGLTNHRTKRVSLPSSEARGKRQSEVRQRTRASRRLREAAQKRYGQDQASRS